MQQMTQSGLGTVRTFFVFASVQKEVSIAVKHTCAVNNKLTFHLLDLPLPGDARCSEIFKIPLKLDPFLKFKKQNDSKSEKQSTRKYKDEI